MRMKRRRCDNEFVVVMVIARVYHIVVVAAVTSCR